MERRLFYAIEAVIGVALLALPLDATASPTGFAWDSVTKIMQNADPASLQPGSFDADYATAAQVQQSDTGGGFMGKIKQAMAMGKLMQTGIAQKHYVAGSKERTDDIALATATIVDCAARTTTTLDLRAKTYRVVSMDSVSGTSSSGGSTGSPAQPNDNGTRVAVEVTNTALGSMLVAGQSTNGFRSDTRITETNSSGQSQTQNAQLVGYYTSYAEPAPTCSRFGSTPGGQSSATAGRGLAMASQLMRAIAGDSRISLKQSGPSLPVGKLSMYSAVTFAGGGRNGVALVTERGNLRPIDANDPIFSVPSDFTRQQ